LAALRSGDSVKGSDSGAVSATLTSVNVTVSSSGSVVVVAKSSSTAKVVIESSLSSTVNGVVDSWHWTVKTKLVKIKIAKYFIFDFRFFYHSTMFEANIQTDG
jgi:hypothetical protein